jgi:hypothetical protein
MSGAHYQRRLFSHAQPTEDPTNDEKVFHLGGQLPRGRHIETYWKKKPIECSNAKAVSLALGFHVVPTSDKNPLSTFIKTGFTLNRAATRLRSASTGRPESRTAKGIRVDGLYGFGYF